MAMETEVARTRAAVSKRSFLNAEGEYTPRVSTDSLGFKIELVETGHTVEHKLADFSTEVLNAAALFGLVTSVTNTFGGLKDPNEMAEAMGDRLAALLEGEWSSERETGPRTSDILDAYIAFRAKHGKDTSEDNKEKFLNSLKSKATTVKDLLASETGLAAEYYAIKARRVAERADKKAKEAAGSTQGESTLLD